MSNEKSIALNGILGHGATSVGFTGGLIALLTQSPDLLNNPLTAIPLGVIAVAYTAASILPNILQSLKDFRNCK